MLPSIFFFAKVVIYPLPDMMKYVKSVTYVKYMKYVIVKWFVIMLAQLYSAHCFSALHYRRCVTLRWQTRGKLSLLTCSSLDVCMLGVAQVSINKRYFYEERQWMWVSCLNIGMSEHWERTCTGIGLLFSLESCMRKRNILFFSVCDFPDHGARSESLSMELDHWLCPEVSASKIFPSTQSFIPFKGAKSPL